MSKIIVMLAAVLTFTLAAAETEVPQMEAFLGYNYVRFNPNSARRAELHEKAHPGPHRDHHHLRRGRGDARTAIV